MSESLPDPFEYSTLDEDDTVAHWTAIRMNAREIQIPESVTCSVMMNANDEVTGVLMEFHRLERSIMDAHVVTLDMETVEVMHRQFAAALRGAAT